MTASVRFTVPGGSFPTSPVGRSFGFPYGVYGLVPRRTIEDAVRSVRKHFAELLAALGSDYLQQGDTSWEVRLWDEKGTLSLPFARIAAVGPDASVGPALYADVTQAMTVHLYPHPAQDTERAIIQADRLRGVVQDAIQFGAARGKAVRIPLWDFAGATGLYDDSEARQPSDFLRVEGLTTERMVDPEDDRYVWVVINFRAVWRRVPGAVPGHLVESVRVSANPS